VGVNEFIDWVRRGFGALSGGGATTVTLDVGAAGPVSRQVATYTPGDVTGLDPRAVIRTSPRDGTQDFEPNLFAMVELADPALPWLASAGPSPWIVLVVVEDRPGVALTTAGGGTSLSIQAPASPAEELPDLSQSSAWAHAQGPLARLIAPRQLAAGRSYHACIVPAFAAGVAAALGNPPAGNGAAWTAQTTSITLPVLYAWHFATGPGGDFASLARELRPDVLDGSIGHRLVDASAPGWGMPRSASAVLDVACVLRAPSWQPPAPPPAVTAIGDAIAAMIDSGGSPPPLAPPFYGRLITGAASTAAAPTWQRTLARDVAARIAAGIGAALARSAQDELIDAAWRAMGDAEAINHAIRLGQLAAVLVQRLATRHLGALASAPEVLAIARPLYSRVLHDTGSDRLTVTAAIAASAMPSATLGTGLRRLGRAGGLLSRAVVVKTGELAAGLDRGTILAVPPRQLSSVVASFDGLAFVEPQAPRLAFATPQAVTGALSVWFPGVTHAQPAVPIMQPATPAPVPNPAPHGLPIHITPPPRISIDPDLARAQAFAAAARAHQDYLLKLEELAAPVRPVFGDPAGVRAAILASFTPERGMVPMLQSRIVGVDAAAIASFTPVRPTPVLERPLLPVLFARSPDAVMTNASSLARNRVAIARADQDFVRALLVGANDELGRELLWRGFPAPLEHTWLRTFWGRVVAGVPTADIPPIESWPDVGPPTDAAQLVLIVRGDVLHRYPNAVVYAVEASWQGTHRVVGTGAPLLPVIASTIGPDLALFGFELSIDAARGTSAPTGAPGWYFVIAEHPAEPRFGLAVSTDGTPRRWRDVGWDRVQPGDLVGSYLRTDGPLAAFVPADEPGQRWGAGSAQLAAITVRHAVRVAFHASTLVA
jgi:hypothetical protein